MGRKFNDAFGDGSEAPIDPNTGRGNNSRVHGKLKANMPDSVTTDVGDGER